MRAQKIIIAFIALFIFATAASAQFGDLMKKAQDKIDKSKKKVDDKTNQQTTTNINTGGGNNNNRVNANNDDARWDLFKCKPQYSGSVNEAALREMVQYNVNNDYGNGGVIVFTKQPLNKPNATVADSVMTFKAGEPIYMNVVLKEALEIDSFGLYLQSQDTIVNVGDTKQCASGSFKYSIQTDYGRFDKSMPQAFTLDFQPQGGKSAKYQKTIKLISEQLRELPAGMHIVPVRLYGNNGGVAVGAFYYDTRDGKANSDAINNQIAQVFMPKANPKFASIERQMVAELGKLPGGKVLRAVVTDSDWTPLRHEISGVLIGRAITAVLAVKVDDGTCFRETQSWTQDYNGNTYTNLRLTGTREREDMACENVSK